MQFTNRNPVCIHPKWWQYFQLIQWLGVLRTRFLLKTKEADGQTLHRLVRRIMFHHCWSGGTSVALLTGPLVQMWNVSCTSQVLFKFYLNGNDKYSSNSLEVTKFGHTLPCLKNKIRILFQMVLHVRKVIKGIVCKVSHHLEFAFVGCNCTHLSNAFVFTV
jgi:hypothetical protein